MKLMMSGWSTLRMTILAARRVLPPDLMTPAKASKPFMKLSGPLAVPPPARVSVAERRGERLVPVPDPHLKSMPSVFARVRMESSESCTELMKQAEHCGLVYPVTPNSTRFATGFQCQLRPSEFGSMRSHPTLNQTGELKAAYWRMRRCTSSPWNVEPSSGVRKWPCGLPQSRMVSATRATSWRTPVSGCAVPTSPCKYLDATMLVAVTDQSLGTSTSFCSKMIPPFESVIWARRYSHSTSSYGEIPALVKKRRMVRPVAFCLGVVGAAVAAAVVGVWVWISAMVSLPVMWFLRPFGAACLFSG